MAQKKGHKLTISFVQETDGKVDGQTLIEEYTSDMATHLIKTQVFTEELTKAVSISTKRLTDMGLAVLSS